MKLLLFGFAILLAQPSVAQHAEPVKTTRIHSTPESAFITLSNDVGDLMRRAMSEASDDKALALLQGQEAAALSKRQQQLRPALMKWLKTLSSVQREAFAQRMLQNSGMMKFMQSMDQNAKANARLERNSKLGDAFQKLVYEMFVDKL